MLASMAEREQTRGICTAKLLLFQENRAIFQPKVRDGVQGNSQLMQKCYGLCKIFVCDNFDLASVGYYEYLCKNNEYRITGIIK